ncbi:MAG: rhodanese-like domain-containing protein [Bacteroides sp.]|jgi:rhodanese-related sulfurtransferase|nr:rhodanese-like domain-containing protein [Bacteroides sp.]
MKDLFEHRGFWSGDVKNVTPREAFDLCQQGAVMLDVRADELVAFKCFGVSNWLNIWEKELSDRLGELSKDLYYILADSVGIHSKEAYHLLRSVGFERIVHLAGGLVEWERDGLPVLEDVRERLSGSCTCQLRKRERKGKIGKQKTGRT